MRSGDDIATAHHVLRAHIPWPLPESKLAAFNAWEATANATMATALGRYGTIGTYRARQHPLSWFREQVMNVSSKAWCRDVEVRVR